MYEDFLKVKKTFVAKSQKYEYSPSFYVNSKLKSLMTRSRNLYAIRDRHSNFWINNDGLAIENIDEEFYEMVSKEVGEQIMNDPDHKPIILRLKDTDNHLIDKWHKFYQKDIQYDTYKPLNQKVLFSNSEVKETDYATYCLDYPILECPTPFYDKLVDVLYLPSEREKFEWMIGCLIAGEQSKVQKFFVFYGEPGSGKSTIIGKLIVDNILGGKESPYCSKFTAGLLANKDSFGTGFLARDPIFAFDDDADLSRIESNTTLNLIVSHEAVRVNDKFERTFTAYPNCFLVCGTNEPVQLNPNSGLNRRLIDIRPTGERLTPDEYDECLEHLAFEKSGIAYRCLKVYRTKGKNYYNHYQPEDMLSRTSPFHNFVKDNYIELKDGITLPNAYKLYCSYCEECNLKTIVTRYKFRDNLKLYFDFYTDQVDETGRVTKNYFSGFKSEKIGLKPINEVEKGTPASWLDFSSDTSLFDSNYISQPAQYAKEDGSPQKKWDSVTTVLGDIDTHEVHYVKVPKDLIVIDFDIKDSNGNKSFEKNFEAASKFQPTYAELSKSGSGIHLHYIYTGGDPEELSRIYSDNVEVKVFTGNSALRRKLTKCNLLPIAILSSGLPLKGVKQKVSDWDGWKNVNVLRSMIIKNLNKEYHPATKPSIDYIYDLLSKAKDSGISYDLRKLSKKIEEFAGNSTHNKVYCLSLVKKMNFCSDDRILEGDLNDMIEWSTAEVEKSLRGKIVSKFGVPPDEIKDSIDYIFDLLSEIYRSGINYDLRELEQSVFGLALQSTKADYCVGVVSRMHFCSDNYIEIPNENKDFKDAPIVFVDVESSPEDEDGPALFLICWKYAGDDKKCLRMFNPTPEEVSRLFNYRLVGHNIRDYDAPMMYAASQGYTPAELNNLSNKIINGDKSAQFREAKNIAWADTLDFAAADNKKGLKKWEIFFSQLRDKETGELLYPECVHDEWDIPWDKSVPKERWNEFADYCCNDVRTTEILFNYIHGDFEAREILSDLSGLPIICTTNQHTTQILVGDIKDPKKDYIYTDLSKMTDENGELLFPDYEFNEFGIDRSRYKEGTKIVSGKSIYKGIDPGEGGRKIGYPGYYEKVGLFDVASMHPHSAMRLNVFGDVITKRLANLVEARVAIKHILTNKGEIDRKNYNKVIKLLGEKVRKYLPEDPVVLKKSSKSLSNALKTAINSVYGLTSASFDNKLKDPRNKDNIVAKYGALFMINLEEEVTKRGYKVVHVSTDSIKIADVDDKIADFIFKFGEKYGYTFEYEKLYSKMCLINDAVYIAKVIKEDGVDVTPYWTATGKQFAVPYVFKTLFSHEEIIFDDMCETFSVKEGAIYLDYNETLPDVTEEETKLKKLLREQASEEDINALKKEIAKGHDYIFVGRVGQFTPVIQGIGGAILNRIKDEKPYALQGTKGYRWLESAVMRTANQIGYINRDYYRKLVDDAKDVISKYCDFELFVSDDISDYINPPIDDVSEYVNNVTENGKEIIYE